MSIYSEHLSDAYRLDKYVNNKLKVNNNLIENKNHVFHSSAKKKLRLRNVATFHQKFI